MTRRAARQKRAALKWVPDLVRVWREQAEAYERDGQPGAPLLRRVADELETWLAGYGDTALTLVEAARESGYSQSQLRRLIQVQVIPNRSENGEVRIRRADLPRKPGRAAGPNLTADLLGLPGAGR